MLCAVLAPRHLHRMCCVCSTSSQTRTEQTSRRGQRGNENAQVGSPEIQRFRPLASPATCAGAATQGG